MFNEDLKFSLWADFIEREYLDGGFGELIDKKIINGATSNPAIFKNAILSSSAYRAQLAALDDNLTPKQKYEALAVYDIQKAADILYPLYEAGDDGFVSIEVDPFLCDDTQATIDEGKRLHALIGRDNVMIKVPATEAGYSAMEELVSHGIALNATLIFTQEQAINCAKAFERGMQRYGAKVETVISVFVSRIDRVLDKELKLKNIPTALMGIYNAATIYATIEAMQIEGCRVLFASTGVKDNSLPAHYYIEKLLARNSINTAPIETIEAFVQDGNNEVALPIASQTIETHMKRIEQSGIDLDDVFQQLITDGLEAFKVAFKQILEAV